MLFEFERQRIIYILKKMLLFSIKIINGDFYIYQF